MAKRGDVVEHPVTGERITFLKTAQDTGGEYSRSDLRVRPRGFVAVPHVHPRTEETFEILSGKLFVSVGTVMTHLNNLYRKLDSHSRTQALARARELKLL